MRRGPGSNSRGGGLGLGGGELGGGGLGLGGGGDGGGGPGLGGGGEAVQKLKRQEAAHSVVSRMQGRIATTPVDHAGQDRHFRSAVGYASSGQLCSGHSSQST